MSIFWKMAAFWSILEQPSPGPCSKACWGQRRVYSLHGLYCKGDLLGITGNLAFSN